MDTQKKTNRVKGTVVSHSYLNGCQNFCEEPEGQNLSSDWNRTAARLSDRF